MGSLVLFSSLGVWSRLAEDGKLREIKKKRIMSTIPVNHLQEQNNYQDRFNILISKTTSSHSIYQFKIILIYNKNAKYRNIIKFYIF